MEIIEKIIDKNGVVFAFLFVGIIILVSYWISKNITRNKIPGVAIAIIIGLAFLGDKKGIANIPLFSGMVLLGGSMLRDFSVVSTAMGADLSKIKQAGTAGVVALFVGITISFIIGVSVASFMGYTDAISLATIGAEASILLVR